MNNSVCLICSQPLYEQFDLAEFLTPSKGLDISHSVCPSCKGSFKLIGQARCVNCSRSQLTNHLCEDCRRWEKNGKLLKNTAIFEYSTEMHDIMKMYKRYGDYALKEVFQELIANFLIEFVKSKQFDYFVPLPTDPQHVVDRGFDTIKSIFEPFFPLSEILVKETTDIPQSQKNRHERMLTKQTFQYHGPSVTGKILLLDDLYTTGRTLYHARNAILSANPDLEIESFSIIR